VNEGDDEAAAVFFAPGARVRSGALVFPLTSREAVVRMHEALPCRSRLVEVVTEGDVVVANFLLGERSLSGICGGVGRLEAAIFTVRDGKIVTWEILGRPGAVLADFADALRRGENERAGHYFAPGAVVIEDRRRRTLATAAEATGYAAALPCAPEVVRYSTEGTTVRATLRLRDRRGRPVGGCRERGRVDRVELTFEVGRIKAWRVLEAPQTPADAPT
jgi:hypothetical protein